MPSLREIANNEPLFSCGRYLYWAELMRRDWDKFMGEKAQVQIAPRRNGWRLTAIGPQLCTL